MSLTIPDGKMCIRDRARIEPEEGKFDPAEIEHYRKVIACCKAHGVEPVVTLLHFTSPKWLIAKGGWEAESTVEDVYKRQGLRRS